MRGVAATSTTIPSSASRLLTQQSILLGAIFFLVFCAYTTIQFYARSTYGPDLAASSVSTLYGVFTAACFVAPSLVNQWGAVPSLGIGILGYASLVSCSLIYFQINQNITCENHHKCSEESYGWLVIFGGALVGFGASLLWTAQGRLMLHYAKLQDIITTGSGGGAKLMGYFWAVFQCSSLVGGAISFWYYSSSTKDDEQGQDQTESPTADTYLYVFFLSIILLGAGLSQYVLLSPSQLDSIVLNDLGDIEESDMSHNVRPPTGASPSASEESPLLENQSHEHRTTSSHSMNIDMIPNNEIVMNEHESKGWTSELRATLALFVTSRPLWKLSMLFVYTGFNQPYQQATYTRFFSKRTIGVELIVFHWMEIMGALLSGRILDDSDHKSQTCASAITSRRRSKVSVACLLTFLTVNSFGNLIALKVETESHTSHIDDSSAWDIRSPNSWLPSIAFGCWGLADALIQVYAYWILGTIFHSSQDHAISVGFYKCLQSLGFCLGFWLIPLDRLPAFLHLALSSTVFLVGTGLAFWQLPDILIC